MVFQEIAVRSSLLSVLNQGMLLSNNRLEVLESSCVMRQETAEVLKPKNCE